MNTHIFKANSFAARPAYLVGQRKNLAIAIFGPIEAFDELLSKSRSNNPATSGVLAWPDEIPEELALSIARQWIITWLLAGVQPRLIPWILVLHREPSALSETGFRTCVHFSVINYHIGLRKAIRPFYAVADGASLATWQQAINKMHGWPDYTTNPYRIKLISLHEGVKKYFNALPLDMRNCMRNFEENRAAWEHNPSIIPTMFLDWLRRQTSSGGTIVYKRTKFKFSDSKISMIWLRQEVPILQIIPPSKRQFERTKLVNFDPEKTMAALSIARAATLNRRHPNWSCHEYPYPESEKWQSDIIWIGEHNREELADLCKQPNDLGRKIAQPESEQPKRPVNYDIKPTPGPTSTPSPDIE